MLLGVAYHLQAEKAAIYFALEERSVATVAFKLLAQNRVTLPVPP